MTIYFSLVFMLLVFEMVVFMTLITPMPFKIKRALFNFLAESPMIAKLQYGIKITFIFILILFVDSVNRVYRVQVELAQASKANNGAGGIALGGSERMEVQARKFYAQRNMYLCGFTLFLSLILNRTYLMILDVLRLEEENARMKGKSPNDKEAVGLGADKGSSQFNEVGRLKNELAKKDKDIETLKKQAKGLHEEYNRLGDQQTTSDGTPKKDR